jgi:S-formylglutathione hydrolase FrmB
MPGRRRARPPRAHRPTAVTVAVGCLVGASAAASASLLASRAAGRPAARSAADRSITASTSRSPVDTAPPGPGRVQILTLPAPDASGHRRRVWVYRPGVTDSAVVPVAYFLHGLPGSYLDLAKLGAQQTLDRLITTGALAPLVVVAPDGNSTGASDPEWADSHDGKVQLESFVTGPLISAVEGTHRRDRDHRFILGFSMGGYGAMNLALRHTDLYSAVASIAGYFDTDDESRIFADDRAMLAANRPDRHVKASQALSRVMLADGSSDDEPITAGETQRFARLLRADGMHPFVDIQPGGHTPSYLATELPRALSYLETGSVAA